MSYQLHHLSAYLRESASRHPDRSAVVDPEGRSITYRDLYAAARRIAGFLASRGVGVGDRVGIMMPKSIETVAAIYGILECGAAYVPIDPTAPAKRRRAILEDCGVKALFLQESAADVFEGADQAGRPSTVVVRGAGVVAEGEFGWSEADTAEPRTPTEPPSLDTLAYILYTSGSTGLPKGVQISHRNASSFVEWGFETFAPTPDDRFSSHAPFHFDLSVFDVHVGLKAGASVHLIAEELTKNPRQLAQFAAERDISVWYSTPSALALLGQFGRLERLQYRGPRVTLFAGEVFPVKHLRAMTQLWPDSQWYNLYGPTETNVCTFLQVPLPVPEERMDPYPIGMPCAHCSALVVGEDGNPVPEGGEGLLLISGDSVFQGYWNRPDENLRAFRSIDGRRWYDTGDLVQLDPAGGFDFRGRSDRMVKRRGYRIELGEVESVLYRHPALQEVGVVALSDEGSVRIVACFSTEGPSPSIIELKQFSSQGLPTYMVPDAFRHFDTLPSTSTGKTDYLRLTDWVQHAEAGEA